MERADGPPIRRIRFYNLEVVLGAVDEKTHRFDVHTNCVGEAPERRLFDGKSRYFGVNCGFSVVMSLKVDVGGVSGLVVKLVKIEKYNFALSSLS